MKQVELRQDDRLMTTWVDKHRGLQPGTLISLKDVDGKWEVMRVHDVEVLEKSLDNWRSFDNNNYDKHEGLFKK